MKVQSCHSLKFSMSMNLVFDDQIPSDERLELCKLEREIQFHSGVITY